jgi:hypothetical protein
MNNNFYNPYLYTSNNVFTGKYVNDYNEVLNTAVPSNGDAMIFVNLDNGMLWSKKLQGNIPYIQAFKITPLFQEVTRQPEPVNNSTEIMDLLKSMQADIDKLKGAQDAK